MKKIITALSLLLCTLNMMSSALAAESCADKRSALEKEILYAKQYNNTGKVLGLEKALDEVNAHCTPASVRNDARDTVKKLQKKLVDKQDDIREAESDLRQATARGQQEKILKYQEKVAAKKHEANTISRQLKQAKRELSGL